MLQVENKQVDVWAACQHVELRIKYGFLIYERAGLKNLFQYAGQLSSA
jgi:hypothetical protein